jgi:hypothetical protein
MYRYMIVLVTNVTKRINLEGITRTGGVDPRKQRVSAEAHGGGVVMVAQVQGGNGGGAYYAVVGVGALL